MYIMQANKHFEIKIRSPLKRGYVEFRWENWYMNFHPETKKYVKFYSEMKGYVKFRSRAKDTLI
jgi:hypothetical protein